VWVNGNEIDCELQEIAENLHRAELTVLERDVQVARWIELTSAKKSEPEISVQPAPKRKGRPGPYARLVLFAVFAGALLNWRRCARPRWRYTKPPRFEDFRR
jgi:hypothetical protein